VRGHAVLRCPGVLCETGIMPTSLSSLIFDLDGTLTDSKPGILGCLRKVLDARRIDARGPLDRFVGPPVESWAIELLPEGSDEQRKALADAYRACYDREGWANNSVYPGVRPMLEALGEAGFPLYICTSKQQHFAVRILKHFALETFFCAVYGDRAEFASHAKPDLLRRLVDEQKIDVAHAWMIGDRIHDIEAARANHVRALVVGWGYGADEERALADAMAATPADVAALVRD